jgi:phosphinothricin acetyltransferase
MTNNGPSIVIRSATSADARAIADIYNQGIEDRIATLETEKRSAEERSAWLASRTARTPVYVAEHEDHVIGWASLNTFNSRDAYQYVADISIYVSRTMRGRGVGTALLQTLAEAARRHGYHKLVLASFAWNTHGMRLYERFGFRTVGVYREQGVLDGRWVDTTVMELMLDRDPPTSTRQH